jgi:hypothetical protein
MPGIKIKVNSNKFIPEKNKHPTLPAAMRLTGARSRLLIEKDREKQISEMARA